MTDTAAADPVEPQELTPEDYQKQINDLKEQVAESNRTAQFWADRAKTPAQPVAAHPAPVAEEDEPDVLEALTQGGAKGFDALAVKRGFARKSDVESMIDAKASAFTREQQLMDEYPDLKNKNSDFFKATAANYGALITQGTPATVAMEMAARQTELAMLRAGKSKPGAPAAGGADDKEAKRLARIAAQSGGSGGRGRPAIASPDDEDDTELTPEQKHIADAMGVSHEAYAKRAKAGVAIGGRGGR